jgi:hypothetical protein
MIDIEGMERKTICAPQRMKNREKTGRIRAPGKADKYGIPL